MPADEGSKKRPEPWKNHKALGARLRQLRLEAELSQIGLAGLSGVHRNTIGGIERADTSATYSMLVKLCAPFGVRPSELLAHVEAAVEAQPRSDATD